MGAHYIIDSHGNSSDAAGTTVEGTVVKRASALLNILGSNPKRDFVTKHHNILLMTVTLKISIYIIYNYAIHLH